MNACESPSQGIVTLTQSMLWHDVDRVVQVRHPRSIYETREMVQIPV